MTGEHQQRIRKSDAMIDQLAEDVRRIRESHESTREQLVAINVLHETSVAEFRAHVNKEDGAILEVRQDIAELNEAVARVTTLMEAIPQSVHVEQHMYVQSLIDEKRESAKFWRDQRAKLATASIWSSIAILVGAVWFLVKHWARTAHGVDIPE